MATSARIYTKLARLTRLTELSLSPCNQTITLNAPKPFLSLRLSSGLGQLGTLRVLERFMFTGMGYDIGGAEAVWMVDHWRWLSRVHGPLVSSREMQLLTKMFFGDDIRVDESF
ncbi:hypothetical protein BGZ59_011719 [Podila verticillata]|nr:hypothetical protein BGZ59_011719 [Podila verticillata]